jgi:predicted phosphoribosyltransferase
MEYGAEASAESQAGGAIRARSLDLCYRGGPRARLSAVINLGSRPIFADRCEAGQKLAQALAAYRGQDAIVYAVPRGGVIVAAEIARFLGVPLDLVITRKIGHPLSSEYAIAAVGEDGNAFTNPAEMESVEKKWFERQVLIQQQEVRRWHRLYLRGRSAVSAAGKTALIVDDGLATGLTMFAAIEDVRRRGTRRVVVAVPVAPAETIRRLRLVADEVVVLYSPQDFRSIGSCYSRFDQVTDAEVIEALESCSNSGR